MLRTHIVPPEQNAVMQEEVVRVAVELAHGRHRVVQVARLVWSCAGHAHLAHQPPVRARHYQQRRVAEARLADAAEADVVLRAVARDERTGERESERERRWGGRVEGERTFAPSCSLRL